MKREIPEALVAKYAEVEKKMALLKVTESEVKEKLLEYYRKGYSSAYVRFDESTVWAPDWKTLVGELVKKYMTPAQARVWFNGLHKRFPRKVRQPRIRLLTMTKSGEIK